MAWTAPRDWVADEVVTAAIMNSAVRDNLRYLKGLDGDITFEDDIITAHNVDGVDVSTHESRHVSGGADEIDSALAIAAMANLTLNKIWKGNASNRPIEIDFPTRTLNPANDTVQEGYYAATTLSAVDGDLAVGNIKSGVTIFGFLGTYGSTITKIVDINNQVEIGLTADWITKITQAVAANATHIIMSLDGRGNAGDSGYGRGLYNSVERIGQFTMSGVNDGQVKEWDGAGVGGAANFEMQAKWLSDGNNQAQLSATVWEVTP